MAERLIHILPEQIASQIAAGEVVERPASAVKELVENSLDAGARRIEVAIEKGGCALISVVDDGCGMSREDAILALRRHATSKIQSAADLTAIRTLGFRGEALASIASVSHLVLRTRLAEQTPEETEGVEITATAGEIDKVQGSAIASGTQIEVRDLFFNTPARLKFLKTVATEQSAVADAITRLALANHRVAFSFSSDGRQILDLTRASAPLERVRQLFGAKLAARMLAFVGTRETMSTHGLLTMSQESFASPRMLYTFVNGRVVRDKLIARAIAQAYQTLLPRGRHPAVVLFLALPPEAVDVNVHPMKSEVRFRASGEVFELVYHTLRERLAYQTEDDASDDAPDRTGVPSASAPRERQSNVASIAPARAAKADPIRVAPAYDFRPLRLVPDSQRAMPAQQALGIGFDKSRGEGQRSASSADAVPVYSRLRVIGQIFAGYIALEDDDGMILIDQHAAHERVTFEKLRAQLKNGGIEIQAMLAPATLELSPARAAHAQASVPELRAMGFDVEPFGPSSMILKGTPAIFGAEARVGLLSDMIESIGDGTRIRGESAFEDLLKQLACHGSVRVGRVLDAAEIHALLADLDRTEFKTNCPHGRPVHIRFPRGQIERMFRR